MPTVAVRIKPFRERLDKALGWQTLTDEAVGEQLDVIGFQFGFEYDGVDQDDNGIPRYRIEVGANRYDLLCSEGLCDMILRFKGHITTFPQYRHVRKDAAETLFVDKYVQTARPYGFAAIFRNVTFDENAWASFIDLQDKLHQNLGRRRTLVAIGTHNLDVCTPPFRYCALPMKGGFKFVPLKCDKEVDAEGMYVLLENSYLKPYLNITRHLKRQPVFLDAKDNVLSVPPIINSEFSKMSSQTKNIFVDITATDYHKGSICLDVITAFLSNYLAEPFTVEPVKVVYEESGVPGRYLDADGCEDVIKELMVPQLTTRTFKVPLQKVKTIIGIDNITAQDVVSLLPQMALSGEVVDSGESISVQCPITRRDVLHYYDIVEDIAVAYGFGNLQMKVQKSVALQPVQLITERVRKCLAICGWKECLTFGLISLRDAYEDLRRKRPVSIPPHTAAYTHNYVVAEVSDPKSKEFECTRPSLVPGLLKTLSSNQAAETPIRLFEVGDVVWQDESEDNLTLQNRFVSAIFADPHKSGLEYVHGLLDELMEVFGFSGVYKRSNSSKQFQLKKKSDDGLFFEGRCVSIETVPDGICLGVMGVVHPDVCQAFNVPFPCSLFEICCDPKVLLQ